MGGGHDDPEAGGGGGGKTMGHASSGPLPTSEPPHLRGQAPAQYQYGTFHPPPVGYPQPAPPPGFGAGYHNQPQQSQPYAHAQPHYAQGYQAVPGSGYGPVAEGRPVRMHRLPCCGLGMGWLLFIAGFFLAAIPWYVGAFILICVRVHDHREKPGYVACTIAAVIAAIVIPLGLAKHEDW